jgi:hypothetical protein
MASRSSGSSGSSDSPPSLADLLGRGRLRELAREAERRQGLAAEVRTKLPAEEGAHLLSAARAETGELVLVMDSAAWAARVRYRAAELGEERLRVKVSPPGGCGIEPGGGDCGAEPGAGDCGAEPGGGGRGDEPGGGRPGGGA